MGSTWTYLVNARAQVLASKSSFSIDDGNNFYFVGGGNAGGYGIVLNPDTKISLIQLCALMNSSLIDWYIKKGSTRFRGGFYSYAKRFIENVLVKYPQNQVKELIYIDLENTVNKILDLKKKRINLKIMENRIGPTLQF